MAFEKLNFQKFDLLVIAAIILIGVVVAIPFLLPAHANENATVQIFQNGQLVQEVSLEENTTLTIPGDYENVIRIQNGKVGIVEADCPGNDCVHTGWISAPGASIVCLPNRVEIRIVGSGGVDLVVG